MTRHFLAISDLSPAEFNQILTTAKKLKAEWRKRGNKAILKNKTLGMVFQKPSLRTRVSFDMAMLHLGRASVVLVAERNWLGTTREHRGCFARFVALCRWRHGACVRARARR